MLIQLIESDIDSGRPGTRMGQGPGHILAGGAIERLREGGHQVEAIRVDLRAAFPLEVASAFQVASELSRQVRMATRQRRFPIVLAGNCMASLGVVAGLPRGRRGILWLDAHGDLHTPETTRSGFVDGMALATIAGFCWRTMASGVPDFRPLSPNDILLLGARALESEERSRLEDHGIVWREAAAVRSDGEGTAEAIRRIGASCDRVHLHLDLDVLDPEAVGAANGFTPPDGLRSDDLLAVVGALKSSGRLASATLSAYDPSHDPSGGVRDAALRVLDLIAA